MRPRFVRWLATLSICILTCCRTNGRSATATLAVTKPNPTFQSGTYDLFACDRRCDRPSGGDAFLIGAAVFQTAGAAVDHGTGCLLLLQIDGPDERRRWADTSLSVRWMVQEPGRFQWTIGDRPPGSERQALVGTMLTATTFETEIAGAWPVPHHPASRSLIGRLRPGAESLACRH